MAVDVVHTVAESDVLSKSVKVVPKQVDIVSSMAEENDVWSMDVKVVHNEWVYAKLMGVERNVK